MKWWPFFNFFIMADADIPFPSTLRKPINTQRPKLLRGLVSFLNFPLVQFSKSPILGFISAKNIYAWTFMHGALSAIVKSAKKPPKRLTHLCVAVVNCLGDSDESPITE